tara:strand:+ start:297 stop:794 length:498 start_codon:yes stop_codon:yes gene_type:complete
MKGKPMQWITDMDLAPSGGEWVLGQVPLEEGADRGKDGTISEVIIFDSGFWTDTHGTVVTPIAWAKIAPFVPEVKSFEYEWQKQFDELFSDIYESMPTGFCLMGLAIGNHENGEGAMIFDKDTPDDSGIMWDADVKKDISHDAAQLYSASVLHMRKRLSGLLKHT